MAEAQAAGSGCANIVMKLPPRPRTTVFFRASALVLFTWATATAVMTTRWWTLSVEGLRPLVASRATSFGAAVLIGMLGAAVVACGLSARGFVRALTWSIATYGLAFAATHWQRAPEGNLETLVSAVALKVGAALVAAMLLAATFMATCWRWLRLLHYRRRETERLGALLLLGSALWTGAIRVSLAAGLRSKNLVEIVVLVAVALACLGLLGLTWHGYWRVVSPPHPQPDSIWPAIPEGAQPMPTAKSKISGADSTSVTSARDGAMRRFALVDLADLQRRDQRSGS
jgi:hypothetical protein